MKDQRLSLRVPPDVMERLERVRETLAKRTGLDITVSIAARRVVDVGLASLERELRIGWRRDSRR